MGRIQRNILLQLCSTNDGLFDLEVNCDHDHSHLRKALREMYDNCKANADLQNVSEAYELIVYIERKYL